MHTRSRGVAFAQQRRPDELVDVFHTVDRCWYEAKVVNVHDSSVEVFVFILGTSITVLPTELAPFRSQSNWKATVQEGDLVEILSQDNYVLARCRAYGPETDIMVTTASLATRDFYFPGTHIERSKVQFLCNLQPNDLVDAYDTYDRKWAEAVIVDCGKFPVFKVHFRGWGSFFDQEIMMTDIAPPYTHVENWRGELREGSRVELLVNHYRSRYDHKQERRWYPANITAVNGDELTITSSYLICSADPADHQDDDLHILRSDERICKPGTHIDISRRDTEHHGLAFDRRARWGRNYDEITRIRQQPQEQPTLQAESSVLECVICMQRCKTVVLQPCLHLCCCTECSSQVQTCPICRKRVQRRLKIFMA